MRIYFKIIVILLLSSSAFSQENEIEGLMTRRHLSCQDIRYNAHFLLPEFYEKNAHDTIEAIIDYWETHCGKSEEITRCRILFAIENNKFSEQVYDSNILNDLIIYKRNAEYIPQYNNNRYSYYNHWNYYSNQPDTLDKFTIHLSQELLKKNSINPLEEFFLKFYSNDFDSTFSTLQTEEFNGTKLQDLYYAEINRNKRKIIGHGDLLLGAWIPQGNLATVGSHTFFGVRGGIRYKRLITDATIGFKFGKSPNIYQVHENDSIWETDHFFGGYIGLDLGFELLRINKSSFDLIGGIAFDGFDALKVEDSETSDNISKSLNSLNLNAGLGYKYNINPWNYLGIDIKYNFVDYKNPMGTDLSGNALTVNLIYGFYGNRYNVNRLRDLDYNE